MALLYAYYLWKLYYLKMNIYKSNCGFLSNGVDETRYLLKYERHIFLSVL